MPTKSCHTFVWYPIRGCLQKTARYGVVQAASVVRGTGTLITLESKPFNLGGPLTGGKQDWPCPYNSPVHKHKRLRKHGNKD